MNQDTGTSGRRRGRFDLFGGEAGGFLAKIRVVKEKRARRFSETAAQRRLGMVPCGCALGGWGFVPNGVWKRR